MLYIPPSQVFVGVKHQRNDSSGQRGGTRGAAEGMSHVAAAVVAASAGDISRGDAFAITIGVRGDEDVCPWFSVVGLVTVVVDCGDGDGEATIGVTVVV